jgi:hypothetical protein
VTYDQWITDYTTRHDGQLLGKCREAVAEMRAAFPELREVRGHVWCTWGQRGHVWCAAPDGTVVDPTAAQFPPPIFEYDEWKPGSEVRVGTCMECGNAIYEACESLDDEPPRREFCDARCYDNYAAYLNGAPL